MAYIKLDDTKPGIQALIAYLSALAIPFKSLMQSLMRTDNGLSKGEREIIASYVSYLNHCEVCENLHGAVACHLNKISLIQLENIKSEFNKANISDRLKCVLSIVTEVKNNGKRLNKELINLAKENGCNDHTIHDTVLIASLFCMFIKYIDGLGLKSIDTLETMQERCRLIAEFGYK